MGGEKGEVGWEVRRGRWGERVSQPTGQQLAKTNIPSTIA